MENFYKDLLQQKFTAKDLIIKGFKQTFGISYEDYLSKEKQMKGACEEIETLDVAIKYYKEQVERVMLEPQTETETKTGVQNG